VKIQRVVLLIAAAMGAAAMDADAPGAEEGSVVLSPQAVQEIARVEAEIDRIEAQALERLAALPDNQVQQVELLGKLMLYDKQLSVNRNEACAFCHMPETGFTGPVSELNPDHRRLSRISAHAIQRSKAAIACLRATFPGAALQFRAR
jgi:cytochrome c peroxidase